MTEAVANRYVTALADLVCEPGSGLAPEQALDQLQAFGEVLAESDELGAVLISPAIAPREKEDLISEIGRRIGLSAIVENFLQIVVEHRGIAEFGLLEKGFRNWLDAYRGRVAVEVRAASEMDSGQKAALKRRFEEITGKRVRATYVVDPDLLGGTSVQVGSTLYDGSLRAALGTLAGELGAEAS